MASKALRSDTDENANGRFVEGLLRGSYIESSTPAGITRHGESVGFYVPARRKRQQVDLDALRKAGAQSDALIGAAGVGEDELIDDFKKARRGARTGKH